MTLLEKLMATRDAAKARMAAIHKEAEASDTGLMTAEMKAEFETQKSLALEAESQIDSAKDFSAIQASGYQAVSQPTHSVVTAPAITSQVSVETPDFKNFGEFLQVVAFNKRDERLKPLMQQSMGTGSAGGIMIPKRFLPEIYSIEGSAGIVRPRANVIEAGNPPDGEVEIPALDQRSVGGENRMYGGVYVKWLGEGQKKPKVDFKLRSITLQPKEAAAILGFTDKMLRNWQSSASFGATLFRNAIAAAEDHTFLTGLGIGTPLGVIPSAAAYKVNRAVASQVAFADLEKMYVRFRGNKTKALWVVDTLAFEELLDMTGDGGGATNIVRYDSDTAMLKIYGIPVVTHDRVPALGVKGDIGLYDFSAYIIKDGSGPIIEYGHADGDFENNVTSMKITFNVDGKPWLTEPFRLENDAEVSPIVVLDVPA